MDATIAGVISGAPCLLDAHVFWSDTANKHSLAEAEHLYIAGGIDNGTTINVDARDLEHSSQIATRFAAWSHALVGTGRLNKFSTAPANGANAIVGVCWPWRDFAGNPMYTLAQMYGFRELADAVAAIGTGALGNDPQPHIWYMRYGAQGALLELPQVVTKVDDYVTVGK
jgi:hypothetical protein